MNMNRGLKMTVLHPSTGRRVPAMIEAAQEDGDQQGHVKHLKLTIRQAGRPASHMTVTQVVIIIKIIIVSVVMV